MSEERRRELNEVTLNQLKMRVYSIVKENYKTKKYRDNEIVDKIRKVIEVTVDNDN